MVTLSLRDGTERPNWGSGRLRLSADQNTPCAVRTRDLEDATGFALAASGSAVGLGNRWQFPCNSAANGGAAFVVLYLLAVVPVGFPAMLAAFVLCRRTNLDAVDALERFGNREWRLTGGLAVATGFWILSDYHVVGGWVMRYIVGSARGAYFADPGGYFAAF